MQETKSADKPLKTNVIEEVFADSISYIDNILEQYFDERRDLQSIKKELNQSFEAKHYKELEDETLQ